MGGYALRALQDMAVSVCTLKTRQWPAACLACVLSRLSSAPSQAPEWLAYVTMIALGGMIVAYYGPKLRTRVVDLAASVEEGNAAVFVSTAVPYSPRRKV